MYTSDAFNWRFSRITRLSATVEDSGDSALRN
jgi:hypothetical protein